MPSSAATISSSANGFPREFRGGVLRTLDREFAIVLGSTVFVIFLTFFLLSQRPLPLEADERQVARIQERYARLVLNVEKPEPPKEKIEKKREREKPEVAEKKKTQVDRKKESVAEKQERKKRTREERTRKREEMTRQISSVGIFAAITSSSDDMADEMVQDLIGTGDVTDQLSNLDITSESFARRQVDVAKRRRREARAKGGTISKSQMQAAQSEEIQRRGSVEVSERPDEVEGGEVQSAERSYDAIGKVIRKQQARLIYVFEKYLKRDPNLSGKLVIKFTILPSGRLVKVKIISSSTGNPEFDDAIKGYVRRWRFSRIPESHGEFTVTYPFVFTGIKG